MMFYPNVRHLNPVGRSKVATSGSTVGIVVGGEGGKHTHTCTHPARSHFEHVYAAHFDA